MTIPALPNSTATKHATSEKSLFEIKKEEKKFLPTTEQRHVRKRIASFNTIENTQSTSKFSVEAFLTDLPEALKVELNTIQRFCTLNNNLTEILNGHGIFYNRLIILLKKIDLTMTENGFSNKQKTKVEKKINLLLTDGKLNLLSDIGREINHLEEYYDTGSWLPAPEDITFFDQDGENCAAQHRSGDFCPEWMKKTEIDPDIPASKAMLGYWNFRHSSKNTKRTKLTDLIVSKMDPVLFRFMCKLRKLKAALHNPAVGTPCSPPGLTRFHIDAIVARFEYADKVANKQAKTNPAFKLYFWDHQGPCTEEQESMQPSETGEAARQTLNRIVEDSPNTSTCHVVKEEDNKPIQKTTGRSLRKRSSYPNYQEIVGDEQLASPKKRKKTSTFSSSSTANKFTRMDKENLLKETGIPAFEKIIKSVLEEREKELIPDPTSAPLEESVGASYHRDRAEVIAAQDELSRLYDACRQHFGINKSLYRLDTSIKSESIKPVIVRTNNPRVEVDIPEPNKPPYTDKPPTQMSAAERTPNFSEAQNAFINMIEKSKELSLKPIIEPERLRGHPEDFEYAPNWQPLSTVLTFPMPFLTKLLAIEGDTNPEATIKLKEKVPELFDDIKTIIRFYRHNSHVWCPDVARETLNPVIQKVRKVQHCFPQIINAFENRQQDLLKSSHRTTEDINSDENQLKMIQEALAKTAIVLSAFEDFSAHLKTEKQQELYQRLLETLKEWSACIKNTPESLLPAVRERGS
ncbi:hypothetical protein [Endozoicomonas sp. ALC013]|uniref:hypothetical protein n=1 Tax=Endozoicomonas sp. ALC013 TaxID=3403076 RepID=UPI003BB71F09